MKKIYSLLILIVATLLVGCVYPVNAQDYGVIYSPVYPSQTYIVPAYPQQQVVVQQPDYFWDATVGAFFIWSVIGNNHYRHYMNRGWAPRYDYNRGYRYDRDGGYRGFHGNRHWSHRGWRH